MVNANVMLRGDLEQNISASILLMSNKNDIETTSLTLPSASPKDTGMVVSTSPADHDLREL